MALPVFAEFMQRAYADTQSIKNPAKKFEISKAVDLKLDCGESIQNYISNDEEF